MIRRVSVLVGFGLCMWLLSALPTAAQPGIQAHNHIVVLATTAVTARPALTGRSILGLINTGGAAVYCTVDGTTATASPVSGIRLAASGTVGDSFFFPRGSAPLDAISCIAASGTSNVLLIIEGR